LDLTIPRVLMWQFLTGSVLAAVLWLVFDRVAGYSAMLGSLVCLIPNAFLALRLSVPRRNPGAAALMNAVWIGELGKLALTILFFSLVFALVRPLSAAALFAGFIATQLVVFSGLLMRSETERDTESKNGS
jgi:ATP synthase protein I